MLVFLTIFSFLSDSYLKFSSFYYALPIQKHQPNPAHSEQTDTDSPPLHQSNRIMIHKPPDLRLVIPHQVVMQPSLFIIILVLQSERLMRTLVNPLILFQTTPCGVFAEPQEVVVFVCHLSWDADLVAVEVVGCWSISPSSLVRLWTCAKGS